MISAQEQTAIMAFIKTQNKALKTLRTIERNVFIKFGRKIELSLGGIDPKKGVRIPDRVKFFANERDKTAPKLGYNLFLDDIRDPAQCIEHMKNSINTDIYKSSWMVVRDYEDFINTIELHGLPQFISFDHDLAKGHYHKNIEGGEINYDSPDFETNSYKTGYHCAQWLAEYCLKNKFKIPAFIVHSQNPVGKENINKYLTNAKETLG